MHLGLLNLSNVLPFRLIATVLIRELSRRGPQPQPAPKPHALALQILLQVVSLLEGGPASPFWAELGQVLWAEAWPPEAHL